MVPYRACQVNLTIVRVPCDAHEPPPGRAVLPGPRRRTQCRRRHRPHAEPRARAPGVLRRHRRRLPRRDGRQGRRRRRARRPATAVGPRRGRAQRPRDGGRARRDRGRVLRRRRRVRARGARSTGRSHPRRRRRLRRRFPLRRHDPPDASASALRQPCAHSRGLRAGARTHHGRAERLSSPVGRGRARGRDRPRLQLRASTDARPRAQGLPLRRGADLVQLPARRALVRPAAPLSAQRRACGLAGATVAV